MKKFREILGSPAGIVGVVSAFAKDNPRLGAGYSAVVMRQQEKLLLNDKEEKEEASEFYWQNKQAIHTAISGVVYAA